MATEIVNFSDLNRSGKSLIVRSIGKVPINIIGTDIEILNLDFDPWESSTYCSIAENFEKQFSNIYLVVT